MTNWQLITTYPPEDPFDAVLVWNGKEVCPASLYEDGWFSLGNDQWPLDPQPSHWTQFPDPPTGGAA